MSRRGTVILLAIPLLTKDGLRATAAHHRELVELWRPIYPGHLGAAGAYHEAVATSLELAAERCINIPVITAQPNIMAITRSGPDPAPPNASDHFATLCNAPGGPRSSTSCSSDPDAAVLHNYSPRFGGFGAEYSCGALTQGKD